jgi:hypothetical protein
MHIHLMRMKGEREFILCGDINIAHRKEDLKNWRGNQKNSGFLPEERAWMDMLLDPVAPTGGIVDVYRVLQPDTTDACYTWWSNRGQAYANNVGGGWTTTWPPRTGGTGAPGVDLQGREVQRPRAHHHRIRPEAGLKPPGTGMVARARPCPHTQSALSLMQDKFLHCRNSAALP